MTKGIIMSKNTVAPEVFWHGANLPLPPLNWTSCLQSTCCPLAVTLLHCFSVSVSWLLLMVFTRDSAFIPFCLSLRHCLVCVSVLCAAKHFVLNTAIRIKFIVVAPVVNQDPSVRTSAAAAAPLWSCGDGRAQCRRSCSNCGAAATVNDINFFISTWKSAFPTTSPS